MIAANGIILTERPYAEEHGHRQFRSGRNSERFCRLEEIDLQQTTTDDLVIMALGTERPSQTTLLVADPERKGGGPVPKGVQPRILLTGAHW